MLGQIIPVVVIVDCQIESVEHDCENYKVFKEWVMNHADDEFPELTLGTE